MKQSAKKNYLYNVSYQVFALLVPLVTTPYISRVLGDEGIGTYSYTYSIVRYFWLLSALGIATFGTKYIGINQESKEKRSQLFWDIFSLKIILSAVMIISYYLYAIFIAKNQMIAIVQGIYLFGILFDISWFYQGMENFKKISIRNFVIKILNVIFIFAFVKDKGDLIIYIFGLAAFQFFGNLSLWVGLHKLVAKVKIKTLRPFRCFKPSLLLFIPSIATQIFAVLDKSMIGWITGSMTANGHYEQAFKIIDMLIVIITTLSTVMIPKVASEFKKGNRDTIMNFLNTSFKFIFFLSLPMCAGMIIIAPIFVPWFFGEEYIGAISILQILSILFVFIGITSVTGSQYLISTDQTNKHIVMLLCGGGVNVFVNLILIPVISANGAAVGSLAGEVVVAISELAFLHCTKQYNVFGMFKSVYKFFIAAALMAVTGVLIKHFMSESVITMIVIIGACMIVYMISLLVLKEQFVLNEIKTVLKRMKKQ